MRVALKSGVIDEVPMGDLFRSFLRAMAEPTLSCADPGGESYRFLWLRTWGPPVAGGPYRQICLSLLGFAGLPAPGSQEERDTVY